MSQFSFPKKIMLFLSTLFLIAGCFFLILFLLGPPPLTESPSILVDQEGHSLLPPQEAARISFDEIPDSIIQATLAVEDRKFFSHIGIDLRGIGRAFWKNIQTKSKKEGASTITQQLAKNLYLSNEKTWSRKWKEMIYAFRLEIFYSKEEILQTYMNTMYYGHGIYGIQAASLFYFDKLPTELTVAEIALLVGIPKGPSYYSPHHNQDLARERQAVVLSQLLSEDMISNDTYEQAIKEEMNIMPKETINTAQTYFTDYVWQEAAELTGLSKDEIRASGFTIYTTLDRQLQDTMERAVSNALPVDQSMQISSLSIRPSDGAIIGMVGGKSYDESSYNRATQAKRMVGSTFKPFVYYAALEKDFTAASMLKSEPTTFHASYQPRNYGDQYANKPVTLAQALAVSDNIYAVKTQAILGADSIVQTAKRFGIQSSMDPTPALALGTASISLKEMVHAYSLIANHGFQTRAHTITQIDDRHGRQLYKRKNEKRQVFSEEKIYILQELMKGMFEPTLSGYMPVTGSSLLPKLTQTYAGKSGTTDTDHWMIGFTPDIVTGVWTGYDNASPITKSTDKVVAKNVWIHIMENNSLSVKETSWETPAGIEKVPIDLTTGYIATPYCPKQISLPFEKHTAPTRACPLHGPNKEASPKEEQSWTTRLIRWMKQLW